MTIIEGGMRGRSKTAVLQSCACVIRKHLAPERFIAMLAFAINATPSSIACVEAFAEAIIFLICANFVNFQRLSPCCCACA